MNISAASLNSSTSTSSTSSSSSTSESAQLEKQKQKLQKEIQTINQSQDDEKTKQNKVDTLNLQIQGIDAQIMQLKSEEAKQTSSGSTVQKPQRPPSGPPPTGAATTDTGQNTAVNSTIGTQVDLLV